MVLSLPVSYTFNFFAALNPKKSKNDFSFSFFFCYCFLRAPLKLSFSCPVDEKSCKVQVLEDRKQLRCHFRKSEFWVFGRACIKRPPIMDLSNLSTWSKKDDVRYCSSFLSSSG